MKYYTLFITLFCLSCGAAPGDPSSYDKDLLPYIKQFFKDAHQNHIEPKTINSVQLFDGILDDHRNVMGVCYRDDDDRNIQISKIWWDQISEMDKQVLVSHELAHCSLDRFFHRDSGFIYNDKPYMSIMNSILYVGNNYYEENWELLKDELFHPKKYLDGTFRLDDNDECNNTCAYVE